MFFIQNIWWNLEEVDYHFKDNESFLELKKGFQAISLSKVIFNLLGFYFLLSWVFVLGVHCHWGETKLQRWQESKALPPRRHGSFLNSQYSSAFFHFKARAGLFWKLARNPSGPKALKQRIKIGEVTEDSSLHSYLSQNETSARKTNVGTWWFLLKIWQSPSNSAVTEKLKELQTVKRSSLSLSGDTAKETPSQANWPRLPFSLHNRTCLSFSCLSPHWWPLHQATFLSHKPEVILDFYLKPYSPLLPPATFISVTLTSCSVIPSKLAFCRITSCLLPSIPGSLCLLL